MCRCVSFLQLCAIIVLGTISDKVTREVRGKDYCGFDDDFTKTEPCDFGIAMGAISLVAGLVFAAFAALAMFKEDLLPASVMSVMVMLKTIGAGILAFLWLVCFGVLANAWRKNDLKDRSGAYSSSQKNAAQSAIAFSFFSMMVWVSFVPGAVGWVSSQYCIPVSQQDLHCRPS